MSEKNGAVAESDWDEAQLTALVGLDESPEPEGQEITPVSSGGNVVEQADLFEDEPKPKPHDNQTKRTLSKNPYAKFAVIALGLSIVFGIGGLALTTMMSNPPKNSQKTVKSSPKQTPSVVIEKKKNDEGKLKTQLALSTQAEELKGLDEKPDRKKEKAKPKTEPGPSPSPSPTQPSAINRPTVAQPPLSAERSRSTQTSTSLSSRPQRVYSPPPPRMAYNQQPEPTPLSVPALPPPPPVASSPPPQTQPSTIQKPEEQDQTEQWAKLASLGSYGQVVQHQEEETNVATGPVTSTEANQQVVQAGTVVSGEIAVPIAIPEDGKGQHFAVQLTDNLLDVDGQVAIAEGQFLVFEVEGVDGSGLVSAKAISVVDEQGNERTIASAFSLESDGRPLVAQKLFDIGPDVASMDFGMVALGAISKVGEILNRPKQQSSTSTSGGSTSTSSTSTSRDPNLLGAIMEGGATPVLEAISKRNSEAIERMNDRDNAWVLSPGKKIQVRVTQPLRI